MIQNMKLRILRFITMNYKGELIQPCGRCIESMLQIDVCNKDTIFYIEDGLDQKLKEVYKLDWKVTTY